MERESFIFYRSFYEAIKCMPPEVQAEIYPAVCEYALFGKLPKNLSEIAKGMFALIKPNIDTNTTRYINGQKGAQYGKRGGRPKKNSTPTESDYSMTYEQEVDVMRSDDEWRQAICNDFNITVDEYDSRLSRFLTRCNEDAKKKGKTGHDSAEDAKSHLRYWMTKAFPQTQTSAPIHPDNEVLPPPDYSYNGGFGSVDI